MTELGNFEDMTEKFDEIKTIVDEIKEDMMSSEDCNNQFYSVLQTLDGLSASIQNIENEKSKPTDEYTILQTNILEVKRELGRMNQAIDETINGGLQELMSKLNEKVNRLEILTNNTGIDQQVIMNITGQLEKNISSGLEDTTGTLFSQYKSYTDEVRHDVDQVNDNLKECVDYLEKSLKTVSSDAVQHLSDDMTILGTTFEKTTDNLKRSIIDIFSRIQETVENGAGVNSAVNIDTTQINNDLDMLKNGIFNLNANTEKRINKISKLISELDIFTKLEKFAQLKDLPAIGDLKHTLKNNIDRIVDKYSYTLQSSQDRNELTEVTQQFRADVYNEIISLLGNVSEFLLENDGTSAKKEEPSQMELFAEKIEELTSVTELNNSGYDNIHSELRNLREQCVELAEMIQNNAKKAGNNKTSLEESLTEIKNSVTEINARSESLRNNANEISDVVRECANSIIENSTPDRISIKDMLSDIKKNISILQSGDEETDYTYSMQDIESDVAKIRIYLNELSQNGVKVNSEEFTDELNSVVVMVDSMKQQLNKIDECDISDTMSKMKEDLTSISTRVNKLLLTSDNSYNMIESALKEFKVLSEEIDEQVKKAADTNKFKTLEDSMTAIRLALGETNSYNNVINQSLIMLAEWVDNAGETITNIYEKQSKLDSVDDIKSILLESKNSLANSSENVVSAVREMLADTNTLVNGIEVKDYSIEFSKLAEKFSEQNSLIEKQEERMNKLDEKLTTVLEMTAKNDIVALSEKINSIETQMEKLNRSIEKLTAYVNED